MLCSLASGGLVRYKELSGRNGFWLQRFADAPPYVPQAIHVNKPIPGLKPAPPSNTVDQAEVKPRDTVGAHGFSNEQELQSVGVVDNRPIRTLKELLTRVTATSELKRHPC